MHDRIHQDLFADELETGRVQHEADGWVRIAFTAEEYQVARALLGIAAGLPSTPATTRPVLSRLFWRFRAAETLAIPGFHPLGSLGIGLPDPEQLAAGLQPLPLSRPTLDPDAL